VLHEHDAVRSPFAFHSAPLQLGEEHVLLLAVVTAVHEPLEEVEQLTE